MGCEGRWQRIDGMRGKIAKDGWDAREDGKRDGMRGKIANDGPMRRRQND